MLSYFRFHYRMHSGLCWWLYNNYWSKVTHVAAIPSCQALKIGLYILWICRHICMLCITIIIKSDQKALLFRTFTLSPSHAVQHDALSTLRIRNKDRIERHFRGLGSGRDSDRICDFPAEKVEGRNRWVHLPLVTDSICAVAEMAHAPKGWLPNLDNYGQYHCIWEPLLHVWV
jgi:hypothetical protein